MENNNKMNTLEGLLGLVIIGRQLHPDKVNIGWLKKTFANIDSESEVNQMDILESLLDVFDEAGTNNTSSKTLDIDGNLSFSVSVSVPDTMMGDKEKVKQFMEDKITDHLSEMRSADGVYMELNYRDEIDEMIEDSFARIERDGE